MQTIYTPKGPAYEYGTLALNLWTGCAHDCDYCYVRGMPRWRGKSRAEFANAKPRGGIEFLRAIERKAALLQKRGVTGRVFLCFTCDALQPLENTTGLTFSTIKLLHKYGLGVNVLTKAGELAQEYLPLFDPARDAFGITLTTLDARRVKQWEPHAAQPWERIAALQKFHDAGVETWGSLEPVINPQWTLEAIEVIAPFVRYVKIGKWNHDKRAHAIDWRKFHDDAIALCKRLGVKYYLKADLVKAAEKDGKRWTQVPEVRR